MPIANTKRRKVALLIAGFLDAGCEDPSISELAPRLKLSRNSVVALIDQLERDKVISVLWGESQRGQRNRYRISYLRP